MAKRRAQVAASGVQATIDNQSHVDEIQWHRGHKYQKLAYQIDEGRKRLLWIGPDRTAKTLLRFLRFLGKG